MEKLISLILGLTVAFVLVTGFQGLVDLNDGRVLKAVQSIHMGNAYAAEQAELQRHLDEVTEHGGSYEITADEYREL